MLRVFLAHTPEMFAGYYGERALAGLRRVAEVVRNPGETVLTGRALAEAARGCQAIVADRATPGTAETFAHAPDLACFLRCAVDISTIDVAAASAAGVLVTRATPGFVDAVAELGIGFIVDLARGVTPMVAAYRAGEDAPEGRMGLQLSTATIGIVGYGRIAVRLAQIAQAIGMRVVVSDPYTRPADPTIEYVTMEELLPRCDIVVCLAIANAETHHLFNAAAFARMRRGSYFVNLSRGQLVDERALEAALDSKHIAGAAMDVGMAPDQRPSPFLARRPDVVATPHIAGLTPQAIEHQAMDTVRQIESLAEGRVPDNAVNLDRASRLSQLGIVV